MRKVLFALTISAAMLAGGEAFAQMKPNYNMAPKINVAPKITRTPVIRTPAIRVIPPSLALNRAMMIAPNAKALGVKLRGGHYIVKLKQGNKVRQVQVDAATGDVSQ